VDDPGGMMFGEEKRIQRGKIIMKLSFFVENLI
jgi:hypothetical protein